MWRELNVPFVYTIEASFYGASNSKEHFALGELEGVGRAACEAVLILGNFNRSQGEYRPEKFAGMDCRAMLQELSQNRALMRIHFVRNALENNESPEDDSEEEDNRCEDPAVLQLANPEANNDCSNLSPTDCTHHRTKSSISSTTFPSQNP